MSPLAGDRQVPSAGAETFLHHGRGESGRKRQAVVIGGQGDAADHRHCQTNYSSRNMLRMSGSLQSWVGAGRAAAARVRMRAWRPPAGSADSAADNAAVQRSCTAGVTSHVPASETSDAGPRSCQNTGGHRRHSPRRPPSVHYSPPRAPIAPIPVPTFRTERPYAATRRSRHRTRARRLRAARRRRTTPQLAPGAPGTNLDDLLLSVGREAGILLYLLASGGKVAPHPRARHLLWLLHRVAGRRRARHRRQGAVARAARFQDRTRAPGADARRPVDARRVPRRRLPRDVEDPARAHSISCCSTSGRICTCPASSWCTPSSRRAHHRRGQHVAAGSRASAGRGLSRAGAPGGRPGLGAHR